MTTAFVAWTDSHRITWMHIPTQRAFMGTCSITGLRTQTLVVLCEDDDGHTWEQCVAAADAERFCSQAA